MRKLLTLITLFIFFFQSCKKDNAPKPDKPDDQSSISSITFKLDGQLYTYSGSAKTKEDSGYGVSAEINRFMGNVIDTSTLVVGVQKNGDHILIDFPGYKFKPEIIYLPSDRHADFESLTIFIKDKVYFNYNSSNKLKFIISEVNGKSMNGTFSGPIYEVVTTVDQSGHEIRDVISHSITEGKFKNIIIPL